MEPPKYCVVITYILFHNLPESRYMCSYNKLQSEQTEDHFNTGTIH